MAVEMLQEVIFFSPAVLKPSLESLIVINWDVADLESPPVHVDRLWRTPLEERRAKRENVLTELSFSVALSAKLDVSW